MFGCRPEPGQLGLTYWFRGWKLLCSRQILAVTQKPIGAPILWTEIHLMDNATLPLRNWGQFCLLSTLLTVRKPFIFCFSSNYFKNFYIKKYFENVVPSHLQFCVTWISFVFHVKLLESLISLVSTAMFECLTEPKAISELFPGNRQLKAFISDIMNI